MGKTIGWEDEDIVSGFRNEKERQFRGKKGVTYIIRVMNECEKYRVHAIDDILDPDKDGEARVFNMNCSKEWDEDAAEDAEDGGRGDWVGDCGGCEAEYDLSDRFIAGIVVLGELRGKSERIKKVDPEDSPHFWDFGADKYRSLSDIRLSLKRGKKKRKLSAVELQVSCNSGKPEIFQDLNIIKCDEDHDVLTTQRHVSEWKEQGKDLVEEAMQGPKKTEWKRRLKKKKAPRRPRDDEEEGGEEAEEEQRRAAKKKPGKKEEPEEGSTGDEELDGLLAELE